MGIRADIETDLAETLEDPDDYGMPVELFNPATGIKQTQSANDSTSLLYGQVLYFSRVFDPATGMDIVAQKPVITLRITSLDAIPARGWVVRFALSPVAGAPLVSHYIERATENGKDIGFIRLYPGKLVQE